jgi:hypothetical protein
MAFSPGEGRAYATHVLMTPYAMLGMRAELDYWFDRGRREWPDLWQGHLWRAHFLGLGAGGMDYRQAIAEFGAVLASFDIGFDRLGPDQRAIYGSLLALAGDHQAASAWLEPWVGPHVVTNLLGGEMMDARHALAWAYQNTGAGSLADAILHDVERDFREREASGEMHLSDDIFAFARNTLLLGNKDHALELLERAAEAGWRGYYQVRQDPRWDALRDEPRFQAVMARVKADLDEQRARVEAIEATDDFAARLDAAIAAAQNR